MSLILEALRKSEAERRRAQAPDLFAPAQVAVAPARPVPLAWLAGGGTLVAVVAVVALLLVRAFAPEQPRPANAVAATDAPPVATLPAAAGSSARANSAPRLLPAAEAPSTAATDAPPSGSLPQAGNADGTPAAASEEAGEAAATAPVPVPPPAAPAAPVASPTEAAPTIDAAAQPLRLSGLAADARRQLPPLKLTMHMWNEAADRRFVILDGRRLAEGDRIGAVQVAEIRRDGVILDWNGQRLELPLH